MFNKNVKNMIIFNNLLFKLFLVMFIFCCYNVKSQTINLDTINKNEIKYKIHFNKDTIKKVFLICDTSKNHKSDTLYYKQNNNVYWITGYEVINWIREFNAYIYDIQYLNENKKKLNDNFIIWEIK